jgi:hypothetical protein
MGLVEIWVLCMIGISPMTVLSTHMGWLHILGFWVMTLYNLTGTYQRFRKTSNLPIYFKQNWIRSLPCNNCLHLLLRRRKQYIHLKHWSPFTYQNKQHHKLKDHSITVEHWINLKSSDDCGSIPNSSNDLDYPLTLQRTLDAHSLGICGWSMKLIILSRVNFNYPLVPYRCKSYAQGKLHSFFCPNNIQNPISCTQGFNQLAFILYQNM